MTCAIPPLDQAATRVGRGWGEGWNRERTDDHQLHGGMDFVADAGTPVLAPIPGVVLFTSDDEGPRISSTRAEAGERGQVRRMGGYGNCVVLVHAGHGIPGMPDPFWTSYNHLQAPVALEPGTSVRTGDLLGHVGNTTNGQFRGMGAHLHMEVRRAAFPGAVGHDGYELDTMDPSELFAAVGIDWIDHRTEVRREVGGQLLIRSGGPSDPAVCSGSRALSGPRALRGLGYAPPGYIDPASPAVRGKYLSKPGGSYTGSVQVRRDVLPPDYGAGVNGAKLPVLGLWPWQWAWILGIGGAGVVGWAIWRWQVAERKDPAVAEEHLPLIHLIYSNLKAWINGVHHGVAPQHLQAYLNEFTFRFNRRFYPFNAFRSLLGIGGGAESPTYADLYSGEWQHPGSPTDVGHG